MTEVLCTKEDMRTGNTLIRAELHADMAHLRAELKQDISQLRVELKEDIAQLRVEISQAINKQTHVLIGCVAGIVTFVTGFYKLVELIK